MDMDEMQIDLIPYHSAAISGSSEDHDPEGIELRKTSSVETPGATHLGFKLVK